MSKNVATLATIFCLSFFAVGCEFVHTDSQEIEIDLLPDKDQNAKLAEDLAHYNMAYLIHNISAFDEPMREGILFSSGSGDLAQRPIYKIHYDLTNDAVSSDIDTLKQQFDEYIPRLAALHVSKKALFSKVEQIGEEWLSLFLKSPNEAYEASSIYIRNKASAEQFASSSREFTTAYGQVHELSLTRAQYYEQIEDLESVVNLTFYLDMSNEMDVQFSIALHLVEDERLVHWFRFEPMALQD